MRSRREKARLVATVFVEEVNARTVCADCGSQPIEWHHDDHPQQPNARVSSLRSQGCSVTRIQREMDRCTPYCRSCHMKADGRAAALPASAPQQRGQVYVGPKPCAACGREAKPTRLGLCYTCYERQRCGGRQHVPVGGCCVPRGTEEVI